MHQGAAEDFAEVLKTASEIPGCIGVFNETPRGGQLYEFEKRSERP
jgi:hypothetical protein